MKAVEIRMVALCPQIIRFCWLAKLPTVASNPEVLEVASSCATLRG